MLIFHYIFYCQAASLTIVLAHVCDAVAGCMCISVGMDEMRGGYSPQTETVLDVTMCQDLNHEQVNRLFDVAPGLDTCHYDHTTGMCALVWFHVVAIALNQLPFSGLPNRLSDDLGPFLQRILIATYELLTISETYDKLTTLAEVC